MSDVGRGNGRAGIPSAKIAKLEKRYAEAAEEDYGGVRRGLEGKWRVASEKWGKLRSGD